MKFKFNIGDKVTHKADLGAETFGDSKEMLKSIGLITEKIVVECYSNSQHFYHVRWVHRKEYQSAGIAGAIIQHSEMELEAYKE